MGNSNPNDILMELSNEQIWDLNCTTLDMERLQKTLDGGSSKRRVFLSKEVIKRLRKIFSRAERICLECGVTNSEVYEDSGYEISVSVEGDVLHIVFPELLADRIGRSGKNKMGMSYGEINSMYAHAFRRAFSSVTYEAKESIVIYFRHFYQHIQQAKDHDNFELKPVIDNIASSIGIDDSPQNCSLFCDYAIGEYTHTEIFVVFQKKFIEFFKAKNI